MNRIKMPVFDWHFCLEKLRQWYKKYQHVNDKSVDAIRSGDVSDAAAVMEAVSRR